MNRRSRFDASACVDARRGGFTLVELIVALVLFSVGILALSSVLLGTDRWASRVEAQLELVAAAEGKLDQLRRAALAGTADTVQLVIGGSLDSDLQNHSDTVVSAEGRTYIRRWKVEEGPVGTREVTLRVASQNTGDRRASTRDFVTLVLVGF